MCVRFNQQYQVFSHPRVCVLLHSGKADRKKLPAPRPPPPQADDDSEDDIDGDDEKLPSKSDVGAPVVGLEHADLTLDPDDLTRLIGWAHRQGVSLASACVASLVILARRYQGLDEADVPLQYAAAQMVDVSQLANPSRVNPIATDMSSSSAPAASQPVAACLTEHHTIVDKFVSAQNGAWTAAAVSSFWDILTGTRASAKAVTVTSTDLKLPLLSVSSIPVGESSAPAAAAMTMLLTITNSTRSPFHANTAVVKQGNSLHVQLRWQPLAHATQGDPRRRSVSHVMTLWASLLQAPMMGTAPIAPPASGAAFTVGTVPIVSAVENDLLLNSFSGWVENGTGEVPLAAGEILPHIWTRTAQAHPKRPAIVSVAQNISWTYEYVEAESNRLAQWLQQSGVTPGMTVGMFLPRSAQV